jgi:hypothetical protein
MEQGVTPDDVRRAVRLMYHLVSAKKGDDTPWETWLAQCGSQPDAVDWFELVPQCDSAEDYLPDGFGKEDAALLARVGAVFQAMRFAPGE